MVIPSGLILVPLIFMEIITPKQADWIADQLTSLEIPQNPSQIYAQLEPLIKLAHANIWLG